MKVKFLYLSIFIISVLVPVKAQIVYSLKDCISIGLEKNFSILVARNSETISTNNFTLGNAGFLPTIALASNYSGTLNNTTQNITDGTQTSTNGINNTTANAGATLGWTIFRGFNVQTTYKKLNELKQLGTLNTQLTVENFLPILFQVITTIYSKCRCCIICNMLWHFQRNVSGLMRTGINWAPAQNFRYFNQGSTLMLIVQYSQSSLKL